MQFQIWDAADPRDRQAWIECWRRWPGREIFGHPDYVRLYIAPHTRAVCAAASEDDGFVLYPFLMRSLDREPYCHSSLGGCTDIVTPYGYGGPFHWGKPWDSRVVSEFWRSFDVWAARSQVVSEVVRFSLFPETLVDYPGCRRVLLDNIVRVLDSESEMWRDFEYKVRKNVQKARSSRVSIRIDETGECLDDFLAIYTSTMDRRNAAPGYYFPRDYFEAIHRDLRGQFAYFYSVADGAVVSTELVLISADRIYSFLGGTHAAWFHVRPNDLMKFEIMNWGRSLGKKEFVLGGGNSRDDGICRYKLSFAPHGSVPFAIGSRVLSVAAYEQLVRSRHTLAAAAGTVWQPKPEYFPVYRG